MLGIKAVFLLALSTFVTGNFPVPTLRIENVPKIVEAFQNEPAVFYRLPNNTRPISYDVEMTTHVHTHTDLGYSGQVSVRFVVLEASRTITLHQRQLTIGTTSLVLANNPNQPIQLTANEYNSVNEFLTVTLAMTDLVVNSEYILTIAYNGTHRTDKGFFYSSYKNAAGVDRWLAATHLEQTDARHVFPCFDEPALRALFTFRVIHGTDYHVLSNMPVVLVTPGANGYSTTNFAQTSVPVPTYLLAFLISEFESKSLINKNGFEHRIFAQPNGMAAADFGLTVGLRTMDAFEEYLGVKFTLPKMDQAAVPGLRPGAMENWGLILYREPYLLYDEQTYTHESKLRVATVIAHEWAHQWFGNRVTIKWWTYIWLNEGFAALFENYGTDWLFPEWKILDAYVFRFVQDTMVSDSTLATRPITHYGESPAEVSLLFDNIGYAKASCVLNMFLNAFTESSFKKGLTTYLNRMENSAAVENDLFEELEKAVKSDGTLDTRFNVPTIFASWTHQAGFPLVTVERNYINGDIVLTQERYLSVDSGTPLPSIWWIPYNFASASDADFNTTAATNWISSRSETINIPSTLNTDWFLVNKRQTGYYRVIYDLQNYKLLAEQLRTDMNRIHLTSRSQLIDDAFDFARTDRLGYDVVFDLIKYLEHEVEYVPWASTFRGLELVDRLYAGSETYPLLQNFIVKQLDHLFSEASLLAANNEHHFRKDSRNQAIRWSCRLGSSKCLNETNAALEGHLTEATLIHQDHRGAILCAGIRSATELQFNLLLNRLANEIDIDERSRLVRAAGCISDQFLAERLLLMTINEQSIYLKNDEERYFVFSEIAGNQPNSTKLAFEFLEANIDTVNTLYGRDNVNNAVKLLSTFVSNDELTEKFNDLVIVAQQKTYIDVATISSGRVTLAANERWITRNQPVIEKWLQENSARSLFASVFAMTLLLFVTQLF